MIFNTLHNSEAKMNQRGAEFPSWLAICLAAGAKTYAEIGCGVGRTTVVARETGMRVVGVDLCPHPPSILQEERPGDEGLGYVAADSSSTEALNGVLNFLGDWPDAVFIDADHSYGKSKKDWEVWWPHTKLLLGFHDILIDLPNRSCVGTFWNEIRLDIRSLEIFSRDRKAVVEWQGQGCLDASPDGHITAGGIGILFKE